MRDLIRITSAQYRRILPTIRHQLLDNFTEADFSIGRLVPEDLRQRRQEAREQGQAVIQAMEIDNDDQHMPALDPVPEPEKTFEEFLNEQFHGTFNPGEARDQSEKNHRYIQDLLPYYNRQQLEVFYRIFVRNNPLVTVEG